MGAKIKAHLWTLPRWFATPFFGVTLLIGAVLAGGTLDSNVWLAFLGCCLIMAGGHSFNTLLDTYWTKLDEGEEISSSKEYAAGVNVISSGVLTPREVLCNALLWYALALIPLTIVSITVSPIILAPAFAGMLVTFWYSKSKFTKWSHELALAAGPVLGALMGAMATGTGFYADALLVSIPIVMIFSYAGLALDEYPDAENNLAKGVQSLPYVVWLSGFCVSTYILIWMLLAYCLQVLYIAVGILEPLTALTFILVPPSIAISVHLKMAVTLNDMEMFKRPALLFVLVLILYPVLLLVGQMTG